MKSNGMLILQGAIYAIIGALTPVAGMLATQTELTKRTTIAMIVAGIMSGATALKAFLSTTFADSSASIQPGTAARAERLKR
jgi:hypothetical protein